MRIEQTKNFRTEYKQGLAIVSSCGTNLLPLEFDTEARLVTGNQPTFEEPNCYLDGWHNATFEIRRLYDNVTDVFKCQFMRKFKADGRIETLKIGMSVRFIAGFAIFQSTTTSERIASGMTHQLNYTITDSATTVGVVGSSWTSWWTKLLLAAGVIGLAVT